MPAMHLANLHASAAAAHGTPAAGSLGLATVLGLIALFVVPIGILLLGAFGGRPPGPSDNGDGDSGWGRGGWDGPHWPDDGPSPPHGDPVWWPEFERQFAAYVGRPVGVRDR